MKRYVKILCLVIGLCLLAMSAAACAKSTGDTSGNSEKTTQQAVASQEAAKPEEPLKFVYHNYHQDRVPEADNEMGKWLREEKNVEITYETEALRDKTVDKLNLLAAGGDLPDVCSFETYQSVPEILQKMGEAGTIITMDEWITKYPEMTKLCDSKYNELVYKSKKDGKMYFIPINIASHPDVMQADVGPIVREDWLKQVGMDAPKTTDELYEVLKAFRDKIPDVDGKKIIPATFDGFKQFIAYAWTKTWYDLSEDKKSLEFQFNDPDIEGYMVYMNKLYREKLLDPEFITQQNEAYMAKLSSGRAGYTVRVYWDLDRVNAVLKAKNEQTRFIPAPAIRLPDSDYIPVYANPSYRAFSALVISSKFAKGTKNLERLMEFLSWTASDEALKMLKFGPDGKYYTKNSSGLLEMKPEFKAEKDKPNSTFEQKTGLGFYNLLYMYMVPSPEVNPRTEESAMGNEVWKETIQPMPIELQLTTPGPVEQQKWGQMWEELNKWTAKAVLAKSEEECRKAVQEMLKAYETNGGRDIVNERLKSIREFMENK